MEKCAGGLWAARLRVRGSAEPTGDILLSEGFLRCFEEREGGAILDEATEIEQGGEVGHAEGLLHVVSDNDDGVASLQLREEFLDPGGGDGVEGGAGFIHEQDAGFDGDGAGDAEALLLTA